MSNIHILHKFPNAEIIYRLSDKDLLCHAFPRNHHGETAERWFSRVAKSLSTYTKQTKPNKIRRIYHEEDKNGWSSIERIHIEDIARRNFHNQADKRQLSLLEERG